ncbi:TraX family protein [Paenibacillus agricola]|uniref:Conjugal transfer protein TraX n=1 Tax=Paenibacillus agricola TaxID=2716264 RepID=A0ABX0J4B2_9BACL|nr:TraX family protein [Paenibacillus agricola]NHN30977.1 conjugal transfer protein TraX [Paenibacillus agricola]
MGNEEGIVQPTAAKSNPLGMQRELLQIVAMLTMLIDHIGAALYPDIIELRLIGRLSFPLYAFGIVQGYLYTRNMPKYFFRLGLLALISQAPYYWAFDYAQLNVIGTFFICILTLLAMDRVKIIIVQIVIATAAFLLFEAIPTDYGTYALMLIIIYRYTSSALALILHFFLNLYYYWTGGVIYQYISMLSSFWLVWGSKVNLVKFSMPRWLWLSFYPAHLMLLALIKWFYF